MAATMSRQIAACWALQFELDALRNRVNPVTRSLPLLGVLSQ